jgi:long-chain acyl-CoA synthetase
MNISNHIKRSRRFFPNKPAIIFGDQVYSYALLDETVSRLGNALRGLSVGRGDRVALYLPNGPEFVIAYLAAVRIGAIAVSINAMFKREEVQHILTDSGAKVLFTLSDLLVYVPHDDLVDLQHVIVCQGECEGHPALAELIAQGAAELTPADMGRDDPAVILYTSGTTATPKGAVLSHGNITSNTYSVVHHSRLAADDRLLLFLPLFHVFGQNHVMNSCFTAGATLVLHRRFEAERVLTSIQQHRVTCFFGVPTVFVYLLNMDTAPWDLSSLRYYFTAAATMPPEIALRWQEATGLLAHEGYGMTECSPCASYNHDFRPKLGSIGEPIENVEMKVVDEAGNELPPGEWGEIVIRGPGVMLGYWNKPAATAEAIRDGWLHSGDIGTTDDEGYFYVVDRLKDMINAAGFKVYPAEVENVIYRHTAVQEVAVYGRPHAIKGEQVIADIVFKAGASATPQELIAFVRQHLAVYKAPSEINIVQELPKNATGKILGEGGGLEAARPLQTSPLRSENGSRFLTGPEHIRHLEQGGGMETPAPPPNQRARLVNREVVF